MLHPIGLSLVALMALPLASVACRVLFHARTRLTRRWRRRAGHRPADWAGAPAARRAAPKPAPAGPRAAPVAPLSERRVDGGPAPARADRADRPARASSSGGSSGSTSSSGGGSADGGSGSGPAACVKGQITNNEVVMLGDSYMDIGNVGPTIMKDANNAMYRHYYLCGLGAQLRVGELPTSPYRSGRPRR